jgi:hypothetical protein
MGESSVTSSPKQMGARHPDHEKVSAANNSDVIGAIRKGQSSDSDERTIFVTLYLGLHFLTCYTSDFLEIGQICANRLLYKI